MSRRNRLTLFFAFVLAALTAGAASAQESGQSGTDRIASDSMIRVEVVGRTDLTGDYRVDSSGRVTLPLIGVLQAAGRTTGELAVDLSRRYSLVDRSILRVLVTSSTTRSDKIYILGAVLVPGAYAFSEPPSVWDAIAEAGGVTEDGRLDAVEIIPGPGSLYRAPRTVNVSAAIEAGQIDSLDHLEGGDTVRVPRGTGGASGAGGVIWFLGEVVKPGGVLAAEETPLVNALLQTGGPTPGANLSRVSILRSLPGGRVMQLQANMGEFLGKAEASGNPMLLPGDTVYIPRGGGGPPNLLRTVLGLSPFIALITSTILLADRVRN